MKKLDVANLELDDLIERYRLMAGKHAEANENNDYKQANRAADTIALIYSELRNRGPVAQHRLLRLLKDPAVGVRLWSASHALDFAPTEGEAVLRALISQRGSVRTAAETTLEEWQAGRLNFP